MTMRKVRVEDAVGMVLAHDLTKIVPGEYKGPAYRKGHIVRPEDIPYLKNIGKDHIYLLEMPPGHIHENEAITRIAKAIAGRNVVSGDPAEGRVNLRATAAGVASVSREAVAAVNSVDNIVVATVHDGVLLQPDEIIAGVKVIPLVIAEEAVRRAEEIAGNFPAMLSVHPLRHLKVGVVITGNEVYYGRIQDRYGPVFADKIRRYGAILLDTVLQPDDSHRIAAAILHFIHQGADVVIAAGGMSVDPDDVTPEAIRATEAEVVSYGTPVLPGAMFMLAYRGEQVIMGMPACGMYSRITVFDLLFPKILAGIRISRGELAAMGYGGLCRSCHNCTFPHCPFGK